MKKLISATACLFLFLHASAEAPIAVPAHCHEDICGTWQFISITDEAGNKTDISDSELKITYNADGSGSVPNILGGESPFKWGAAEDGTFASHSTIMTGNGETGTWKIEEGNLYLTVTEYRNGKPVEGKNVIELARMEPDAQ